MKVIKILGGLGNQMFQYALAVALKYNFPNETVKIDTSCFNGYPLHQGFELDRIFKINIPKASLKDIIQISYPYYNYRLWQIGTRILPRRRGMLLQLVDVEFKPEVFNRNNRYLDGYWQSEKYFIGFEEIIRDIFKFPPLYDEKNLALIDKLNTTNCVSIHIRRGDYLKTPLYQGICTEDYYKRAVNFIKSKVEIDNFILFSNDIDWCMDNSHDLFGDVNILPVTWNVGENSYKDMQLMSLCTHNIVANSSFSWWGAWLNKNPNKIVISPQKWVNGSSNVNTIPDSWIRI